MARTAAQEQRLQVSELLAQIRDLTLKVNTLLIADIQPPNRPTQNSSTEDSPEYDLSIGSRVMVKTGKETGELGTVTANRGTNFLWVRLDRGELIYRKPNNLRPAGLNAG